MPLQCPQCQSSILAQQIDQQLQATCSQCKTIFDAADQLMGLLAYQHPKKIEPTPTNIDETYTDGVLEITLGRFRKSWQQILAWWTGIVILPLLVEAINFLLIEGSIAKVIGLSIGFLWFLIFIGTLASRYFRRIIITVDQYSLTVCDISIPGAAHEKQFEPSSIKQLYVRKLSTPYPIQTYCQLWILLKQGRTEPLITELKDWPTALYLEQRLEAILKLKDQPVEGELDYLSLDKYRQLLEWETLAERLGLIFIPGPGGGYYEGHYPTKAFHNQGLLFQLDAFYQRHEEKFTKYTRLRLIKGSLSPAPLSPEEATELKSWLAVSEPGDLLMPPEILKGLKGTLEVRPEEEMIYYKQTGIEADLAYLEKLFELMSHIATVYPKILALGGAAVPALQAVANQDSPLKGVARQLLHDIARETQSRLAAEANQLFCPSCLRHCTAHEIKLSLLDRLTYYGCRACGQSLEILPAGKAVIAILDTQMTQKYISRDDVLYGNWLLHGQSFDFDEVYIRRASDEEVERFAVQVGNDTDSLQQSRYANMHCLVWPDANLSENSLKILKRTFGRVEVKAQDRQRLQEEAKTPGSPISRLGSKQEACCGEKNRSDPIDDFTVG